MNPRAICADMAFHDMQAFHRLHNIERLPTGPHTPWTNRAEMGVRLCKKFLSALVDPSSKNLDQTNFTDRSCPVDAKGSNGEKHTSNSEWQHACGVGHGKKTKRSHGTQLS